MMYGLLNLRLERECMQDDDGSIEKMTRGCSFIHVRQQL